LGVSVGSSFSDPLVITTIHGTYSPFQNIYIELGMDLGLLSVYEDVRSYYSIYPYVNLGCFFPLNDNIGFYAAAGGGYLFSNYSFTFGDAVLNTFGVNVTAGVNIFNIIISYTFRTDFATIGNKVSAGYVFRF
jgi:hypothetical protein